jgi:hypothetical protein
MAFDQPPHEKPTWVADAPRAASLDRDAGYRFAATFAIGHPDGSHGPTAPADDRRARVLAGLPPDGADADAIGKRTGIASQDLWPILDELHGEALAAVVSPHPVAPEPFFRHARSLALRICNALGVPAVRRTIAEHETDATLRFGAYVEEYHYIHAAPSYLSRAVASGTTDRQVGILSEYFADEYRHDRWVRQGLLAAGIPDAELERAQPLPSTLALINLLRWLASADLPALCICLGATEGTPDSLPEIDREFDSLRHGNLLPAEAYAPFEEHARIDASQNHGSRFAAVFADFGPIGLRQRNSIREALWQYWYAYLGYHEGIRGHYGGRAALPLFRFA